MAKIHEITKFGGLAQVLGRAREFIFEHDALTIEGVSFEEVQLMLGLLETTTNLGAGQLVYPPPAPIPLEEIQRVLGPAPAPAQPPPLPPRTPAAARPAPATPAPAAPAAAAEPTEKRGPGRPRKPRPDEAKPGALDAILGRAAAAGQALTTSASVPTKPAVEPAPAPTKEEPAPVAPPDEDDDDEDLDDGDEEDDSDAAADDDGPVDDLDDVPEPAPAQVAAKPTPAPAPEPKPAPKPNGTAAPKVEVSAAEKRAEAREKASARTLVDDAEEEAAPRPATPAAAAGRAAPAAAVKPVPNGAGFLLDPAHLPKEIYEAKTMRALISYFVKNGVRTVDRITAECERIRSQSNMLKSVTDLRSRVEAALELLPPQATA